MVFVFLLTAFAFAALTAILVVAVLNALTFPHLRVPPDAAPPLIHPSADTPLVSVLIPARDESRSIAATVRALRAQTYAPFEVVILDDHSGDGTRAIAEAAAAGDPRFRVVAGQPLLDTWLPANWAYHQLSQLASGRVLLFAGAAVQWQPDALKALVAMLQDTQADLLAVWPTQGAVTRAGRRAVVVVPLFALPIFGCLPVSLIHRARFPALAAAGSQCLVFRRPAYNAVGGHIAVRSSAMTGIGFARLVQAKGLRLRLAEGAGLLSRRPYQNWREVRAVVAGSILAVCGGRVSFLLLAVGALLLFVLPWLWLLLGWLVPQLAGYPLVPLALVILGLAASAVSARTARQPASGALFVPLAALLLALIAGWTVLLRSRAGGPEWRGYG